MNIKEELFKLQDKEYQLFQIKLVPNIDSKTIIGVRVPKIRELAKKIDDETRVIFLNTLPHEYYEENILHSILLSKEKDYDLLIKNLDAFLPYVNNWAVSDTIAPKVVNKYLGELLPEIKKWINSKDTYSIRVGVDFFMSYYLDDAFNKELLLIPASIKSDEYYVNMMIAWYYATALAKQWDDTIKIIEAKTLSKWIQNKTIQKARESYRITSEQKAYLNNFKM